MARTVRVSGFLRLGVLPLAIWFASAEVAQAADTPGQSPERARAQEVFEASGIQGGLIVHLGCGDGKLTSALQAGDSYLVLGLDRNAANVEAARRNVLQAGLGGKVTTRQWTGRRLPLADNIARLILVEDPSAVSRDELLRALCPSGVALVHRGGKWEKTVKPWPNDIDEWTHYLHDAGGNAVAKDTRVGPPRHMQWLCGPRWMRNHHYLASISAIVSQGGRIFYILDEGPSANMDVPGKWTAVARDAFNGVLLWKRPIESWTSWRRGFRSGPVQLSRVLVAGPDRVYLPLGVNAPLTALDAATGETIRTYGQTKGTEEVLLEGGVLLVISASPVTAQQTASPRKRKPPGGKTKSKRGSKTPAKKSAAATMKSASLTYTRTLLAIEEESGQTLWKWSSDEGNPDPMSLATDGIRVFFQFGKGVVCLDRNTGRELWRLPSARGGRKTPVQMVGTTLVVNSGVVLWTDGGTLTALTAEDGKQLWTCPARAGFRSPADVFVAQGLVWIGPEFSEGRDLKTGQVKKDNIGVKKIQTAGHHHRCYREKATERYVLAGHRGIEFLDLLGENHSRNNWSRGVCQYGVLPCNGLVYTPPHACGCYMEAKLSGFWAMSAKRQTPAAPFEGERLVKGPAYGKVDAASSAGDADWPTFLHDTMRSSSTAVSLPAGLEQSWQAKIGGRLTAPVSVAETVLVASMDTHQVIALDAAGGKRRWAFTAGGRIDSPPTIYQGLVLVGSADGSVYCIRLSDGQLVWQFFAAPEERLSVAMDQVESVWPVHGSVLVHGSVAYFAAGRSSYLDGGITVYGLDPATGKVLHQTALSSKHPKGTGITPQQEAKHQREKIVQNATDARTFLAADRSDAFSMAGGTISDVMVSNGHSVFMRHVRFDRELVPQKTVGRHLFSTSRLVDETENHRIHWVLGTGDFSRIAVAYSWIVNRGGSGSRFRSKPRVPFGLLLAFDSKTVWGVRRPDGYKGYELTAWKNSPFSPDEKPEPDFYWIKGKGEIKPDWAWTVPLQIRPRSFVRAGDVLVLGGAPFVVDVKDPFAAYEGRKGGLIWVVSTRDGEKISEHRLASPIVWNGLAVASGRLYAVTRSGSVVCLGE